MEAIGDITASAEVSRVPVDGEEFDSRIQGGVLVSVSLTAQAPSAADLSRAERRFGRLHFRVVHSDTAVHFRTGIVFDVRTHRYPANPFLCLEQRSYCYHAVCKPHRWPFLLCLPHPIRRAGQDFRRLLS